MTTEQNTRFHTQSWLIDPEQAEAAVQAQHEARQEFKNLLAAANMSHAEAMPATATERDEMFFERFQSRRPFMVTDGVLQIPVEGTLLAKFPFATGFATGFEFIEQSLLRGMEDENVESIALMVDSPGGMVKGLFELVDMMFEMRGTKSIKAFVSGGGFSAAYALASAADEIVMTKMSEVGSIGVVTTHVSIAEALEKAGVEVTVIRSNEAKFEGNMFEKLGDKAKARIQERVDRLYGIFTSTVARNRGMSEKAVKETEALTFPSEVAIEMKLADRIGSLATDMSGAQNQDDESDEQPAETGDLSMANDTNTPKGDQAAAQAALDAARTDGANTERARFAAVQAAPEFAGREKTANHLLANTDLTSDQIVATLAATPVSTPAPATPSGDGASTQQTWTPPAPAPGADFGAAMESTGNPNVPSAASPNDESLSADDKAFNELRAARAQLPKR